MHDARAIRSGRLAVAIALATTFSIVPLTASAQDSGRRGQRATITGTVSDGAGVALEYALVGLVAADDTARQQRRTLTDAAGEYAFRGVRPGRYRLRFSRLGYEPHTSSAFELDAGGRLRRDVTVQTDPVVIDALVVGGGSACHPLSSLAAAAPDVARLWREAGKAVDIKREFTRSYRYTVDLRTETRQNNRLLGDVHEARVETYTFPDSAASAAEESEADSAEAGGGAFGEAESRSMTLTLPQEKVIVEPEMLRGYCIEEKLTYSDDGAVGLHFRPIDPEQSGVTVEGSVFIERDDYRLRGLTYHYFTDDRFVGTGQWVYGNVRVPGAVLRLPLRGSLRMLRLPAPLGFLIREFDAEFTYQNYREFEPLPAPDSSTSRNSNTISSS